MTHSDCVCNEEVALLQRHQKATVTPPTGPLWQFATLEPLVVQVHPLSRAQVVGSYSGSKRKKFEKAMQSLQSDPVCKDDARMKMFIKAEKYEGDTSIAKPPRCIQYPTKRYALELARFIKPIEEELWKFRDDFGFVFAKSRSLVQRGTDLYEAWSAFEQPVGICLDHSAFDASISKALLQGEFEFYLKCCASKKLRWLLEQQYTIRGMTKNGTKYFTPGTRGSGQQNTAVGNSVVNYAALKSWLGDVRGSLYIDGDDSVVIVDRKDLHRLPSMEHFTQMGLTTKRDDVYEFEHVDFCQGRPVWDGVSWRLVRNPDRAITRMQWTVKKFVNDQHRSAYIRSVAMCELACNPGVPMVQAVAVALIKKFTGAYIKTERHEQAVKEALKPTHARAFHVRRACRVSFAEAWGYTVEEQERFEASLVIADPQLPVEGWGSGPQPYVRC